MSLDIKTHLINHKRDLIKLLLSYGYSKINESSGEIRCSKPNSDNGTTCRIKLNPNMTSTDFSNSFNGDIFTLITLHTNDSYTDIVKKCYSMFDIEDVDDYDVFEDGGLDLEEEEIIVPIYDKSKLSMYKNIWSMRFVKDGIMPKTQEVFSIGYDFRTKRITIPWIDVHGNLIGVMGRADYDDCGDYKYFPLLRFKKHHSLYGIYQNKKWIENNRVYVGESEKFTLQLHTMGIHNATSLGGNTIDRHRLGLLKDLNIKELVFCFDEGLDVDVQKRALKVAKDYFRDEVRVGVMYDKSNKYLPKGSKCAPTDLGKEVWLNMVKDCIGWLK